MASQSSTAPPAGTPPVITLISLSNDNPDSEDDLPPVATDDQSQIENGTPSWTIADSDDDNEPLDTPATTATDPGSFDGEEGEVGDENGDGGFDEDDDAASDWGGDEDETPTRSDEDEDEDDGTFDIPEFEEDEEDESDNERAGMGADNEGEADEADAGSDTEDMVRLIDADGAKNELADFHPMVIVPTDDEVAAMAMVVRDAKGEIIDDKHSNTFPWLTRFEKARVIGTRAAQLSHGAPPQINVPEGLIDSMKIAEIELENGQIPFIIRRPLPDGEFEYWPVNELQVL
jgi:DNA-directed RNA polymerase I, II, and III subunit RPABC2